MTTMLIADSAEKRRLAKIELERRRCASSFAYFVDNYCKIWTKEGGDPIDFKLWDFQKDAAEKMQHNRKVIFLKARQMGLSWLAMCFVVWNVLFKKNFHVYITSIGLREVSEQMQRIRFIWYNIDPVIRGDVELGGKGCKDNDSLIEFTNGSAIHAVSSTRASGHGTAPGLYILDEFAYKENAREAWRAIRPAIGKRSRAIIISTSSGMNNLFAELWFDAKNNKNGFLPVFYSCREHPEYTDEFLEEQKRDFAGDLQGYKCSFPETPEDAFMSSSRSVFDIERIVEWKEYIRTNNIEYEVGRLQYCDGGIEFVNDDSGHLMVWKHPNPEHRYTIGVDIAEGLVHGDYSVIAVLDTDSDEIVALFRAKIRPEEYSNPILMLGKYYNNAWIAIEVNKNADVIINDLKFVYPWLYTRVVRERLTDRGTTAIGFVTSATSKPRIIMNMRRYFSDTERPLKIYSEIALDEMASFEESNTGSLGAAKGFKDDCVMAIALAIEARSTMPSRKPESCLIRASTYKHLMPKNKRSWTSF